MRRRRVAVATAAVMGGRRTARWGIGIVTSSVLSGILIIIVLLGWGSTVRGIALRRLVWRGLVSPAVASSSLVVAAAAAAAAVMTLVVATVS